MPYIYVGGLSLVRSNIVDSYQGSYYYLEATYVGRPSEAKAVVAVVSEGRINFDLIWSFSDDRLSMMTPPTWSSPDSKSRAKTFNYVLQSVLRVQFEVVDRIICPNEMSSQSC